MKKVGKLLLNYKFTILFAIYLYFIISVPVSFKAGVTLLFQIIPLLLILYILAKTKYQIVTGVLFVFIIGINAYFSFVFKNLLGLGFFASIIETDAQEATSVLKDALIPGIAITIVTTLLVFGAFTELKKLDFSRKWALLFIGLYSFVILPALCYRSLGTSGLGRFMDRNPIFVYQSLINLHAPILYGNLGVVASYTNEIYEIKKYKNRERIMPDGVIVQPGFEGPNKIYLILGESSYRKHYSLYGYDTKTTPFLDSLFYSSSSTLQFYQGISPAAITRNAVPLILSFATTEDFTLFYKQKTILDLANEQGYETIWISNQSRIDEDDSLAGNYVGQIAASSSQMYFSDVPFSEDLNLITHLEAVHDSTKKQFIVLHLSGSHMSYNDKYDEIDKQALAGVESEVLAYDRSIHHTDRFLRKVHNIMKSDSSSVLYYLSDHGEIIGLGHGVASYKSEFEIPLLTINNSNLAVDSIVNNYVDHKTSLITSNNSIYILAEFIGYSISDSIVQKAVADTDKIMYEPSVIRSYKKMVEK